MKQLPPHRRLRPRGASLIEAVIAIGVLAVAVPLVFGAIAEAGKTGAASGAETRSAWIVASCLDEVRASRAGRSEHFPATRAGHLFPPAGDVWALAFGPDGSLIGKIPKSSYETGLRELNGKPVRFLATAKATAAPSGGGGGGTGSGRSSLLRLHLAVEHPASAPAKRRDRTEFHSRIR